VGCQEALTVLLEIRFLSERRAKGVSGVGGRNLIAFDLIETQA
jgi:hypothetical protein